MVLIQLTPGQWLLAMQGLIYLGASVVYFIANKNPMGVVMACYGIANFGLMKL